MAIFVDLMHKLLIHTSGGAQYCEALENIDVTNFCQIDEMTLFYAYNTRIFIVIVPSLAYIPIDVKRDI